MSAVHSGRPSNSLHFAVGEINGKLDQFLAAIAPQLAALAKADQDLDSRVGALEIWQARILGGGAILVTIITAWEVIRYVFIPN